MMMDIVVLVIITVVWFILWTLADLWKEEADKDEHR